MAAFPIGVVISSALPAGGPAPLELKAAGVAPSSEGAKGDRVAFRGGIRPLLALKASERDASTQPRLPPFGARRAPLACGDTALVTKALQRPPAAAVAVVLAGGVKDGPRPYGGRSGGAGRAIRDLHVGVAATVRAFHLTHAAADSPVQTRLEVADARHHAARAPVIHHACGAAVALGVRP